ncbi:SDR family NAD(P)-dependent oxidoreductase [Thermaurantiacus sp.]
MRELEGKTILVTGASSGIGRAAVGVFAGHGARVIAAARRREPTEAVVEAVRGRGGSASFLPVDIADAGSVDALFDRIEADFGGLDGAFNNAGVEAPMAPLADTPVSTFDGVMGTNARGTWLCLRREMQIMRRQGRGAIVNTSSIAALMSFPGASAYGASKSAILAMTRSAALDLAAAGIRVNCICPGATRSEMSARWAERLPNGEADLARHNPMQRIAEPEEVAEAASFLLSDRARYINGAVLVIDGGASLG